MWVTIWRHGEAAQGYPDEHRCLTHRGRQSVAASVAAYMARCSEVGAPKPSRVVFSPLVRTTQTAEILGLALQCDPQSCAVLAPGTQLSDQAAFIDERYEHAVIVGHQPFVSTLIVHWLDDYSQPPLMPGGYACLKLVAPLQGGGECLFLQPEIF